MSNFTEWKVLKKAIYESRIPFGSEFDAWLNGYLEGLSTAASIETKHHERK